MAFVRNSSGISLVSQAIPSDLRAWSHFRGYLHRKVPALVEVVSDCERFDDLFPRSFEAVGDARGIKQVGDMSVSDDGPRVRGGSVSDAVGPVGLDDVIGGGRKNDMLESVVDLRGLLPPHIGPDTGYPSDSEGGSEIGSIFSSTDRAVLGRVPEDQVGEIVKMCLQFKINAQVESVKAGTGFGSVPPSSAFNSDFQQIGSREVQPRSRRSWSSDSLSSEVSSASRVSAVSSRSADSDSADYGLCYMKAIYPKYRLEAQTRLESWPTVGKILCANADWFDLDNYYVVRNSDGTFHVVHRGTVSLRQFLAAAVARHDHVSPEGTVGASIRVGVMPKGAILTKGPRLKDVVGGDRIAPAVHRMLLSMKNAGIGAARDDTAGVKLDVGIAMRAQAMLTGEEKNRLRMLAVLGDAAITYCLAYVSVDNGTNPQGFQELRSNVTSNAHLNSVFSASSYRDEYVCIGQPTAKMGGEAMEALFGVASHYYGIDGAMVLFKEFNLFNS